MPNLARIATRDARGTLRAVVETPARSPVKIAYDEESELFMYQRPLLLGIIYPYDWGFFPSTTAPDGDPLDVMILHDGSTFPGVVIPCAPVGVVRLTQRAEGEGREHNDRVIAVPIKEERINEGGDLNERARAEIEQFFRSVVGFANKDLRIEGWSGPEVAEQLIEAAQHAFEARRGAR